MPNTYRTREDMDDERRRNEDPCYYGHSFEEVSRRTKTIYHEETEYRAHNCNTDDPNDCARGCASNESYTVRVPEEVAVIKYRCTRCSATEES